MDDIMGVSIKRLVTSVMAILALVFILIDGSPKISTIVGLMMLMVVIYLVLVLILSFARRIDMVGAGGLIAIECTFGILLTVWMINALVEGNNTGLRTAAYVMDLIVGILFLLFIMF